MTEIQNKMYQFFQSMLDAANLYRRTGEHKNGFDEEYGICGNIECMEKEDGYVEDRAGRVKDNLIRLIPSFSGSWHYPIKGTAEYDNDPERTYDNTGNYWEGEYGANRVQALQEMVDFIGSSEWTDEYAKRVISPAEAMGFVIGQTYTSRDGEQYTFARDDGTMNPTFTDSRGVNGYVYLTKFESPKALASVELAPRTVKALLRAAKKELAAIEKVEAQIKELQLKLRGHQSALKQADRALKVQHGLARV